MKSKQDGKKRFYFKWPWNVVIYIILVVLLRIFAILPILLIMWWNKKQQPDGPEEGYCLQRTRGRLSGLIAAAIFLAIGGGAFLFFYLGQTLPKELERMDQSEKIVYYLSPVLGVIALAVGIFLAYRSLRDALCPEKSQLAKSIRAQLPYPDEAPPVQELFGMVDRDLKENGQWFGKVGIGKEWVLGDEVSSIPRIRGVFGRSEQRITHSGNRTRATLIVQLLIVDDRQHWQITDLRAPKELSAAMECLQQRAPAAIFGGYDSEEYHEFSSAKEEEWQAKERAYRQRKARVEEAERQEQERRSQNQVLTLPDGSVTSRMTADSLRQLLLQCRQNGENRPFHLVPGIPFQGEGRTFSRLVCFPGSGQEPVELFLEEYSGSPGEPGTYGWSAEVSPGEAETVLRDWLRGEVPALRNWTQMEYCNHGWQQASRRRSGETASAPPQPRRD